MTSISRHFHQASTSKHSNQTSISKRFKIDIPIRYLCPGQVNPKTIKLVFDDSLLSGERSRSTENDRPIQVTDKFCSPPNLYSFQLKGFRLKCEKLTDRHEKWPQQLKAALQVKVVSFLKHSNIRQISATDLCIVIISFCYSC